MEKIWETVYLFYRWLLLDAKPALEKLYEHPLFKIFAIPGTIVAGVVILKRFFKYLIDSEY